jgi:hypothetical protein
MRILILGGGLFLDVTILDTALAEARAAKVDP